MNEPALFDYADMDDVRRLTDEIRERVKRTARDIIEIGERLIRVKERLGHGRFLDWLDAEFDWSERTAERLIGVAEAFKSDNLSDLDMAPSAMYALSAPSVPPEVRELAIEKATNGHHVTHTEARNLIAAAAPAPARQPLPDRGDLSFDDGPADEDDESEWYDDVEPDGSEAEGEPVPAPEPVPESEPEPVDDDLNGAIRTIRAVTFGIRRRGGVLALTGHWTPEQRQRAANAFSGPRDEIAGYVKALRGDLP